MTDGRLEDLKQRRTLYETPRFIYPPMHTVSINDSPCSTLRFDLAKVSLSFRKGCCI